MNKGNKAFCINILLIAVLFLYSATGINATSWIKLEPEEVDKRAEIIVYGKYDFTKDAGKKQQHNSIFSPVIFKVDRYYRGSGNEQVSTGIDMFDVGWVQQAQEDGASFLLFLERDKHNGDSLIPVAGPNGMIQVMNSEAKTGNEKEENYFNSILQKPTVNPASKTQKVVLIIASAVLLLIGGFILLRKIRNIRKT